MARRRQLRSSSTRVLSIAMIVIGIALIVRTLVAGGGALARGIVLGVLFVFAGRPACTCSFEGRESSWPPERASETRPFSYRALFAVVYTTSVSSVYFALGVIAHHANGLTPVVFLIAGLFFRLAAMTYAEGASLHPERGGSAVFARYAFNELVSFVAGWAIVLDYTILIAVTALTVPSYLAAF